MLCKTSRATTYISDTAKEMLIKPRKNTTPQKVSCLCGSYYKITAPAVMLAFGTAGFWQAAPTLKTYQLLCSTFSSISLVW